MPNVIACYEKFHPKGFEVVGVSFDQKKEAWVNAVQQMGMSWPQMSDLKGWKCAASEVYGISSIPSSVLVDPQGKIIAMDLRGYDLVQKLTEIYVLFLVPHSKWDGYAPYRAIGRVWCHDTSVRLPLE